MREVARRNHECTDTEKGNRHRAGALQFRNVPCRMPDIPDDDFCGHDESGAIRSYRNGLRWHARVCQPGLYVAVRLRQGRSARPCNLVREGISRCCRARPHGTPLSRGHGEQSRNVFGMSEDHDDMHGRRPESSVRVEDAVFAYGRASGRLQQHCGGFDEQNSLRFGLKNWRHLAAAYSVPAGGRCVPSAYPDEDQSMEYIRGLPDGSPLFSLDL